MKNDVLFGCAQCGARLLKGIEGTKCYILTSDGFRDSADMENVARNEDGIKKILIQRCAELGEAVIPESIVITHNRNWIKYHYTEMYTGDKTVYTDGEHQFFTANLIF